MVKKLFLFLVVAGAVAVFAPQASQAATGGDYPACGVNSAGQVGWQSQSDQICNPTYQHNICYEGLVPCGKQVWFDSTWDSSKGRCAGDSRVLSSALLHCQLCHFFIMANNIINFLFVSILPIITVFMLVLAGVFFYFAGGKPGFVGRGREILKMVVIGLFLIYGAFMIVGFFLTIIGSANVEPIKDVFKNGRIFSVKCAVELPKDFPAEPGSATP
ncbi:MAG: pilin [Patescibacteria group bacterium]|nr:pilin [Patescibacteria group bacterium]